MKLPESFNTISQENKKIVLYKLAEIYSNDDELLEFIDELEGDNIDFVFDIVFAGNEEERNKIREKDDEHFQKLLGKISELSNNINKLIIEGNEFISDAYDDEDLKKLEECFN